MRTHHLKAAGISRDFHLQTAGGQSQSLGDGMVKSVHSVREHRFIAHLSYMGVALLLGWVAPSHTSTETIPGGTTPSLYTVSLVPSGQVACALNAVGQIAGITNYALGTNSRPVVWNQDNPTSTTVAPISQDEFCSVGAINDAGQVVGDSCTSSGCFATEWSGGSVVQYQRGPAHPKHEEYKREGKPNVPAACQHSLCVEQAALEAACANA